MPEQTRLGSVVAERPELPADAGWLPVPPAIFVGGETPSFVLFDARRHVADLRLNRTVYVSPGDLLMMRRYLRRRLPQLGGGTPEKTAARAWALHRVLIAETGEVLQVLASEPDRPGLMASLVEVARLAAEWVPTDPGPYLRELVHTEQDPLTHSVTTALYSLALGSATVATDLEARLSLVLAGLFADAWKVTLPESLLLQPGPLSPEQWALVRQHPEQGAALLMRAGVRSVETLRGVRWHHERWGGGGYPDRLTGRAIPLEARIIGIADAFAALTVDRPFTTGVRGYDALAEMANSTGQFDPGLLRTFVTTIGQALPAPQRWGAA